MSAITLNTTIPNDPVFFLSDLIATPVYLDGKKVGKLNDLLIHEYEKLAEVTHLIVARPFGHKALLIPYAQVVAFDRERITIELVAGLAAYEQEPEGHQVLLKDHVLDKKVIDLDGKEIDIVYDVKLQMRNRRLYVTEVDFSRYGLLKRLGLRFVARFFYHMAELFKKETIPWTYVQWLPETIGSFKGNVRLNILKEALPDLHPVDLADILEELSEEQRLAIFNELETEHASNTLEEIEPRVQRSLIAALDKERVADLIDEMTPAQAADVLAVLPADQAEAIMDLMEHEESDKIEALLENQEHAINELASANYIHFVPDTPVDLVVAAYRRVAEDADVLEYIYVVDHGGRLCGVLNLSELLMAKPGEHLAAIMTTQVVSLNRDDSINAAAEKFTRYGFSALPVLDDNATILGVVPCRDVMRLEHTYV